MPKPTTKHREKKTLSHDGIDPAKSYTKDELMINHGFSAEKIMAMRQSGVHPIQRGTKMAYFGKEIIAWEWRQPRVEKVKEFAKPRQLPK